MSLEKGRYELEEYVYVREAYVATVTRPAAYLMILSPIVSVLLHDAVTCDYMVGYGIPADSIPIRASVVCQKSSKKNIV